MMDFASTWLSGFGMMVGLIIAIGAQNAFIIRQGLMNRIAFTLGAIGLSSVWFVSIGFGARYLILRLRLASKLTRNT